MGLALGLVGPHGRGASQLEDRPSCGAADGGGGGVGSHGVGLVRVWARVRVWVRVWG